MKHATQYREFAEECIRLAQQAKSGEERAMFDEMAADWLRLAEAAEKTSKTDET